MKKFHYLLSLITALVILSANFISYATYESSFSTPKIVDSLNFTAQINKNKNIEMSWSTYQGDLKYYKVSRSQTNANPFYPEDGYIFYSDNKTSYIDTEAPIGKTYYRVCAITKQNDRICSPVITLTVPDKSDICIQAITYAQKGDKCQAFSTSCHVPDGWTIVDECAVVEVIDTTNELKLTAELKNNKPYLQWDFKSAGEASNGYKVLISTKNPKPTYPVMSGDTYQYLPNDETKSYYHKEAKNDKTYYYRICLYINGKCASYSNATSITVPKTIKQADDNQEELISDPKVSFSDVKKGVWFESALSNLVDRGVITGYDDGSFQPSRTVNRAEMAKMVVKALDIKIKSSDIEIFCDVSKDDWFQPYVLQLYFDNVIEGYLGGNCSANRIFKPAQAVTRAEGIKIILIMFGAKIEPLKIDEQTGFTDISNSDWSAPYVKYAFAQGIINGYDDGTFQPNTPLTRAEFVKILSKAEQILK